MSSFDQLTASTAAMPTPAPTKLLYDRKSAAYTLSVSVRTLDYLVANKRLNTIRLGKKVMFGHGELVRFCRRNHPSVATAEVAQ